jgi:hypothetical protein
MKIWEYRVIVPTTVEKYQIGNRYMVAAKTRQESGQVRGEGVELLTNEPYTKENGESGQYTYKIMHFKSRIPGAVRWALPDKYCHCHEKSWNAYPRYHTEYFVPGMGDKMIMNVDTIHIPYVPGEPFPDNALGLQPDVLKQRKVLWLNILDSKPSPKKHSPDLRGFMSPEGGVAAPLVSAGKSSSEKAPPHWTTVYRGPMCCAVKLVTFRFQWFGVQTIAENFVMGWYHDLFLDAHRALVSWCDKWYAMDMTEVADFEARMLEECNKLEFERDESESSSHRKGMSKAKSQEVLVSRPDPIEKSPGVASTGDVSGN